MTRDFLAAQEGRKLATILGQVSGIRIWSNAGGNRGEFVASSRKCIPVVVRRGAGMQQTCTPCYAEVFLDGTHVTRHGQRFDISSIEPADIEAIEYYRGAAESPGRYRSPDDACGVVVIHTRLAKR